MKTQQTQVAQWMIKFGQEVRLNPVIPPLEERKLRAKLILEEALETCISLGVEMFSSYGVSVDLRELLAWVKMPETYWNAGGTPEINTIADGIADSLVVQLGTAVACGIDITPVFDEVMRSNWSKLWTIREVLDRWPTEAPMHAEGFTAVMVSDDKALVKDKDGKVIKSPSYSPANVEAVLKAQTNLLKESAI